jgi:hypothetical protein
MPTAVEHVISVNMDPFTGGGHQHNPDIFIQITGLPLPDTHAVGHETTSVAASVSFDFTGDTHTLKVELLVPPAQDTDLILG